MSEPQPLISCLMVTANRYDLCRRAIQCLKNQTWTNYELVVVDDGDVDLSPLFDDLDPSKVNYIKLQKEPDFVLGKLRNISVNAAKGEYLAQWDDDDWYHPERLARQVAVLEAGNDAVCLSSTLMHLNTPEFMYHPYIGILPAGVPGTIMHRKDDHIRYPETRRAEDSVYLDEWRKRKYVKLPNSEAGMFIRCFHGSNTWEQTHFLRRIRNSPSATIAYFWHKLIRRDVFGHPRFQLSPRIKDAFNQYLKESKALNLLD